MLLYNDKAEEVILFIVLFCGKLCSLKCNFDVYFIFERIGLVGPKIRSKINLPIFLFSTRSTLHAPDLVFMGTCPIEPFNYTVL